MENTEYTTNYGTPEAAAEANASGFSAAFRRTRDVLKASTDEASKLQADTRAALFDVWKDLRSDLNGEFEALVASVKERAEALRQRLPFVQTEKKEEAADEEKTEVTPAV